MSGLKLEFNTSNAELLDDRLGLWRIRNFFNPALLSFIDQRIVSREFKYQEFGNDPANPTFLELVSTAPSIVLLNNFFMDTKLIRSISEMTGIAPLVGAYSRVYKFEPNSGQAYNWHNDLTSARLVGFSVNLSPRPFEGGEFTIRRSDDHTVSATVQNTGYGDAIFFPVAQKFEHCVAPVSGDVARVACAGWFIRHAELPQDRLRNMASP